MVLVTKSHSCIPWGGGEGVGQDRECLRSGTALGTLDFSVPSCLVPKRKAVLLAQLSGLVCSSSLHRSQVQEQKPPQFAAGAWGKIPFQAQSEKWGLKIPNHGKFSPNSGSSGVWDSLLELCAAGRKSRGLSEGAGTVDLGGLGAEQGPRHHLPMEREVGKRFGEEIQGLLWC